METSSDPSSPTPSEFARLQSEESSPLPRPSYRKFQDRRRLHLLLLVLTFISTTIVGGFHYREFASGSQYPLISMPIVPFLLNGLWYSVPLLLILGAHELGHYFACRFYNIDASLPYFLPAPLPLTGTLGAVIRIREAFPNRAALFDVGIAGPIAGFVMLIPVLCLGLMLSQLVPIPRNPTGFVLGTPKMMEWTIRFLGGTYPPGHVLNLHPMCMAAWFGLLATALNLIPFGQLDGGHISYATLGRFSTGLSVFMALVAVRMALVSISYVPITVIMLVMLLILGPRHPRVLNEDEPLGYWRVLLAVFAVFILYASFTPTPIQPADILRRFSR